MVGRLPSVAGLGVSSASSLVMALRRCLCFRRAIAPFRFFHLASPANAEELMDVADKPEVVLLAQPLLPALDSPVNKFDDPAAFQADEVVMVGLGQLVFVPEAPVADIQLADEIHLFQDIQRPVNSGPGNGDSPPAQGEKDVVALPVSLAGQDVLHNGQSLRGQSQGLCPQGQFKAVEVFGWDFHN